MGILSVSQQTNGQFVCMHAQEEYIQSDDFGSEDTS